MTLYEELILLEKGIDIDDTKLEESMWWLQRWVSGSARDPEWDESWLQEVKTLTDALDYLANTFTKSIPNKLYAGVSKKQIKNGHLLPHKTYDYKSFSTDINVAKEFANDYNEPSCVVSITPPNNINMIKIKDFFNSNNPTISKYMFALEDWVHQNEVLVNLDKPLKIDKIYP